MMVLYCKIGNIKIKIETFESDLITKRIHSYVCEPFDKSDVEISIELLDNVERDTSYKLISAQSFRGYCVSEDEYAIIDKLTSPDDLSAALYISRDCKKVRGYLRDIESLGGASAEVRAFNMIGEAFKYVAIQNQGLVFHSSTIDYNGKGILFSADSGTGKSTHTGLWLKYYPNQTKIINDDSPLIRLVDGKPYVFGTPWSGKTDINDNVKAPLSAIVFLKRGEPKVEELTFDDAFKLFCKQSFILPFAPLFLNYVATADKLLRKIHMTSLYCDISKKSVDTIKGYLEEKYEN